MSEGISFRDICSRIGLPEDIVRSYERKGLTHLYEWQAECLTESGVFCGQNLVYCAPTGGGKTLIAELVILKTAILLRKKSILVLPYISLVMEKERDFRRIVTISNRGRPRSERIRIKGYHGDSKPSSKSYEENIIICTIERANMVINYMISKGLAGQLGSVVIDELHVLGDEQRGYQLEIFISKLAMLKHKYRVSMSHITEGTQTTVSGVSGRACERPPNSPALSIQQVALSATIPNLSGLAKWFDAHVFQTDHRPVPLREMVVAGEAIFDLSGRLLRSVSTSVPGGGTCAQGDQAVVSCLCVEGLRRGQQIIIFCPSRNMCETTVRMLQTQLAPNTCNYSLSARPHFLAAGQDIERVDSHSPVVVLHEGCKLSPEEVQKERLSATERLSKYYRECGYSLSKSQEILHCGLQAGLAFHHAGLSETERSEVERMFKAGTISILVATSTLAAGVNLPAGRVIVWSMQVGREQLGSIQYKQMCGRAGRPGLVAYGECFLVVKANEKGVALRLCNAPLPVIRSQIRPAADGGKALLRVMLELFALGLCESESDVLMYMRHTLAYQERLCDDRASLTRGGNVSCGKAVASEQKVAEGVDHAALITDARYLLKFLEVACALESFPCSDSSVGSGSDTDVTASALSTFQGNSAAVPKAMGPLRNIRITRFGRAVVESGLNPDEAIVMYDDLMRARELGLNLETNLHLLYLVTPCAQHSLRPDFSKLWEVRENAFKKKNDPTRAHFEHIGIEEGKLFRWTHKPPRRDDVVQCADRLRQFKVQVDKSSRAGGCNKGTSTSLSEADWACLCRCKRLWAASALNMLIECKSTAAVAATYGVTATDISLLQRNAMFLSFRLIKFCKEIGWLSLEKLLTYANSCIALNDDKPSADCQQLMGIPHLTPKLAHMLVECGYTSVTLVARAKEEVLTQKLLLSRQFEMQDLSVFNQGEEAAGGSVGVGGADLAHSRTEAFVADLIASARTHLERFRMSYGVPAGVDNAAIPHHTHTIGPPSDEDTITKAVSGDNETERFVQSDNDDERGMPFETSDEDYASSSECEEEGMTGYMHQRAPWRVPVAAETVEIDIRSTAQLNHVGHGVSVLRSERPRNADSNAAPALTSSLTSVLASTPSLDGPLVVDEPTAQPMPSYYATLSQCTHLTHAEPRSLYAPVQIQNVAAALTEASWSPGCLRQGQVDRNKERVEASLNLQHQAEPPDIPDEAFLALFEELEKSEGGNGQSTDIQSSEAVISGHRATHVEVDAVVRGPENNERGDPHSDTSQSTPCLPTPGPADEDLRATVTEQPVNAGILISSTQQGASGGSLSGLMSPYLTPYTPSKRTTPGRYLYLPQLTSSNCSPSTPTARHVLLQVAGRTTSASVAGVNTASAGGPHTFAWKHVSESNNCVEFLNTLRRARCASFDLVFAPPPVCKLMSASSVLKAWLPVIAHSPSSACTPSMEKSTATGDSHSSVQHQVLVGIALCFGTGCGYYLPLPVLPPLLDNGGRAAEKGPKRCLSPQSIIRRKGVMSRETSLSQLPERAKVLVCRFVGFGRIIYKCPRLRTCLIESVGPWRNVAVPHSDNCTNANPLMSASKTWAASCRVALRVEWGKGSCVEWRLCSELMSCTSVTKISVNMKDKMVCLRERDVIVRGPLEDPHVALLLLEATAPLSLPMPPIANQTLELRHALAPAIRACYAAIATFRVMGDIEDKLHQHGLWDAFFNIEMPLCHSVVDAELNGVPVDTTFLSNLRQDVNDRIKIIEFYFRTVMGPSFNIASPQDVAILKAQLEQQSKQKWASGISNQRYEQQQTLCAAVSTDTSIEDHSLIQLVKEYRSHARVLPSLSSILSSRCRPCGHRYDRVRAAFHTIGTETGRLTVTSPPLQQVPHECKYIPPVRPSIHQEIMQALDISEQTMVTVIAGANRRAMSGQMEWVRLTSLKSPQKKINQSISFAETSMMSDNGMYKGNGMTIGSACQYLNGKLVRILDACIPEPVLCPESGAMIHLLDIWREAGYLYTADVAKNIRVVEVSISKRRYYYPADQVCRLLAPVVPDPVESMCVSESMKSVVPEPPPQIRSNAAASPALQVIVNPRDGFKSNRGYVLLASDYAQIELRILAHFAMDAKLCAAFDSSSDIFAGIAAQWTGTPVDGISKDDRNRMKQICYALLYGAGPAKVAADAGCSIPEAEGLMSGFMTCYPGIKTFMNQVKNSCRSKGYVETLLGRRRHLRGISSANRKDRARAERQAVNTVCQGSAADLIKLAMINIQHRLVEEFGSRGYHGHCSYPGGALYARMDCVRLVLQVHDELVFEVEEEHLHEVACVVKECMESAVELHVPLKVKLAVGRTWGNLETFHAESSLPLSRKIFENSQSE